MTAIKTSIRVFLIFTILLGVIYPAGITVISQYFFPYQANGSLLYVDGKAVGSRLIGQKFTATKYFHGRFSAVDYDASRSGSENFAPSNKKFMEITKERINDLRLENNLDSKTTIPADMVLSSASGLDPHISLNNALLQAPRIANARNLTLLQVQQLIHENIDKDFIGIWGQSGVNVLLLNIALDKLNQEE